MCGIAGAIGRLDETLITSVRRGTDFQRHRGPDADGFWSSCAPGEHGVAFGHRRLAIIDLSPDGVQPMHDGQTGNVIVFNGEIYNYRALRAELEAAGMRFRTQSDTEVLLCAYASWGVGCLSRLRGMFAFAIWDARDQSVLLARDRLGIKPLYVAQVARDGGEKALLFASEVRALLAGGLVPARLCTRALSTLLWNGFVVGPDSIVEGVRLLPAGTWARVSSEGKLLEEQSFWQLPSARTIDPDEAERELERRLESAVALRLVSDVPLGVFLSGGIDSSAVAALAVRSGGSRLRTFCLGFDEPHYDESVHARTIAAALGTEHTEVRLGPEAFQAQLPDALASLDQPTFDAVNTYFVSRAVRSAGITVALSGAGGDELFGGYRSFVDVPRAARIARALRWLPPSAFRALAQRVAARRSVSGQTRWWKLADALATRGDLARLYQVAYALFTESTRNALIADPALHSATFGLPPERLAELESRTDGPGLHAVSLLELAMFVTERLLRDTDTTSMAVALEVRVPLLDHEVVEGAAAVEETRRFRPLGRKALLRKLALRDLDPALFERPKSGFELPLQAWCRGRLEPEVGAALLDAKRCEAVGLRPEAVAGLWRGYVAGAPGIYWSRVWSLFVLLDWVQRHRVAL